MKQNTKEFLQEPFHNFLKQMEQINYYKSFIKELVEKNHGQLSEKKDKMSKDGGKDNTFTGAIGLSFTNPFNGVHEPLSVHKRTIDNDMESLWYHFNKQYQWLLAEAYEYYEEFLSNLYAHTSYIDNSFLAIKDISLDEISNKDLDWFQEQSKNNKKILKQIRLKIPVLNDYEKDNHTKINFKLHITLIENLRHIIVHKSGRTKKELFIEKILEDLGIYNNGKYDKKYDNLINRYIRRVHNIDTIVLLDMPINNTSSHYDRLSPRLEDLISHAYILNHYILLTLQDKKLIKA